MSDLIFQPPELQTDQPLLWSSGTGREVWNLFCACANGNLETVKQMIRGNPSLVRAHYEYRTPLYFAVRENRIGVAEFLLEHGANPFYNGEDLIEMSRIRGLTEMEALIESRRSNVRSDLTAIATDRSGTALVQAAEHGHLDVVRLLLARGADPNMPEEGNAPHGRALYAAVYAGQVEVARVLLEHGANPNQEMESSADAPSIAIMNSDRKMIELLASYGAVWRIPVELAES
jgi:ankyrin repeat protein